MAISDLGKKYTCASCGTKYYDLNRSDFACPSCDASPTEAAEEETLVAQAQDDVIAGVDATSNATEDAEIDAEEADEDDDGVAEIDLNDEAAELRLRESAGTGDDDEGEVDVDADGLVEKSDFGDDEAAELTDTDLTAGAEDEADAEAGEAE